LRNLVFFFADNQRARSRTFAHIARHKTDKMASTQEFTYQDVAEHNTKKDLYLVIHDVVYDATKFVDEHP